MKLITIVESYQMFKSIQATNDIPIGLAWQIADHIAELAPSFTRFEEKRLEIAQKYGDPDQENAEQVKIRKKDQKAFIAEFEELQNIEIDRLHPNQRPQSVAQGSGRITKTVSRTAG